MTNLYFNNLDAIRTNLWMCWLLQASGLRSAVQLAEFIQSELKLDQYDTTAMRRYSRGSQFPVQGGHPYACGDWVKLASQIWPESAAWFRTPFWFLTERVNTTPEDLVICASGLPLRFREDLLEPADGLTALRLMPVSRDYLYGFTDPINPWSLGALACAMRRAELAGEAGAMRWAGVGILWALTHFLESSDSLFHPALDALLKRLRGQFDGLIYPMSPNYLSSVTDSDISQFDRERTSFLNYFDACDFDGWEPGVRPPWI